MIILGTVASSIGTTLPITGNLFAHWDASNSGSISLNGSNVSQWNDLSSNNKHASQSTAGNQPVVTTAGLNGRNVITFDGTDDFFTFSNTTVLTNNFTVYIVYKSDFQNSTGGTSFIGGDENAFSWYIQKDNRRLNLDISLAASMLMGSNILDSGTNNNWYQANVVWNASSSAGTQRWNKGSFGSFNRSGFNPSTAIKYIGQYGGNIYYMKGGIAEIIIYETAHDTTTRETIEAYFTEKWGV